MSVVCHEVAKHPVNQKKLVGLFLWTITVTERSPLRVHVYGPLAREEMRAS
jgi:hypothetical protein